MQQTKPKCLTIQELDELAINTIRTLSIDAVQQANSGHPGTPMALAPLVYVIWNEVMRFDPQDPIWPNRDRFVLSNGHACMLLWSVLYLTQTRAVNAQYERLGEPAVTLDDIRHFRQLGSKAPGHPEYHLTSGVEATTGPLGQGIADPQHIPMVGEEARGDIFGKGDAGIAVDGDVIVVVDPAQIIQGEMAGERSGLRADAFHQAAVAANGIDVIIE